jgi:hypothetical protein
MSKTREEGKENGGGRQRIRREWEKLINLGDDNLIKKFMSRLFPTYEEFRAITLKLESMSEEERRAMEIEMALNRAASMSDPEALARIDKIVELLVRYEIPRNSPWRKER